MSAFLFQNGIKHTQFLPSGTKHLEQQQYSALRNSESVSLSSDSITKNNNSIIYTVFNFGFNSI